ncbi:MAG: hypothetical protein Q9198_002373 [Flavoplaca austrocitrina]
MHFQYLLLLTVTIGFSITHAQLSSSISSAYGILYCDTGPHPKAATLQTLLPKFQSLLKLVQADAQNAAESQAFRAFFKSLSNAAYVRGVFKLMTDGRPAMIPGEGDPDLRNFEKPNLVCLSPSMPGYGALKQQCGPTSIATTRHNRAFVILCDPFWQLNEEPESLDCPVVRRNVFVQNLDDRILHNQFAAFVHEMAHAYTMSWTSAEQATEGIMDCVNLNPGASVKNVQNYALYAASKSYNSLQFTEVERSMLYSCMTFLPVVVAGCNRYPNPHVFHGERRNLQDGSLEHQPR